eukprot:TRINITY_DN14239_c0_g2_i1.p2 TRINITY_DN14239_c0_g2~~TRINITY_DN14239_c0_g2_i1.p2  ORF type:complete len:162 (-),score=20.16 TRINITY_DN14239_c0_g2_i1:94-534(-)
MDDFQGLRDVHASSWKPTSACPIIYSPGEILCRVGNVRSQSFSECSSLASSLRSQSFSECSTVDSTASPTFGPCYPGQASELPSAGSAGHHAKLCRPCVFIHKDGCKAGARCKFCHLCPANEKQLRKKESKERKKMYMSLDRIASL